MDIQQGDVDKDISWTIKKLNEVLRKETGIPQEGKKKIEQIGIGA
jgi:hypothetical protein